MGHVGGDELASTVSCRKAAVALQVDVLSEVIIIIGGLKGQDKCFCAVCVSGRGVEPAHHPSAKR